MKLSERRKWVVCAHPLKKVPVSNWKILTEKRTGPQLEEESSIVPSTSVLFMLTTVSCVQFSSTLMSPAE